jgi:TRAP-type C4-dicarboxylate transport system permease small subunit
VDFLGANLSVRGRRSVHTATRVLVILLFLAMSWRMVIYGAALRNAKEVSMTLQLPFYPIAYGLGAAFGLQCLVIACDILKIQRGDYE